jgi:hypothetical protein
LRLKNFSKFSKLKEKAHLLAARAPMDKCTYDRNFEIGLKNRFWEVYGTTFLCERRSDGGPTVVYI